MIRLGAAADLVLLDRRQLATGPVRLERDLPIGPAALVFDQEGCVAAIVSGRIVVDDGESTDAAAGTVHHLASD